MFTLQIELEDLQKPQVSLSTQAADLGDEVQVDDRCDVRPSAFTFTLGTQSTSLEPLDTALDIWHEMATQVCFLHFCSVFGWRAGFGNLGKTLQVLSSG